MAATDSTDLVSTPESYIKSVAYNMPVSPGELSGLDEWPTPPKSEADRADREAIYWQRETRKNLARSEAGAIDILPKQTITDRWWLFEKWNFRRYYAATGIVHPSVFSDDFIFHWRSLQKYPKSRKHNGFIENVFSNVIPAHRDKWGNWYFFNVEQTFKKAVAPPTREFSKPSDEL